MFLRPEAGLVFHLARAVDPLAEIAPGQLSDPIWFQLPWGYPLAVLLFEIVQWAIMAVVLAALLRTPASD